MTHVHPAIAEYRREQAAYGHISFLGYAVGDDNARPEVVEVLIRTIPRLYAAHGEDETDVPEEVYALIERLRLDLGMEFPF